MVRALFHPDGLEKRIVQDSKFVFTLASYALIVITYINLNTVNSAGLGIVVFALYFSINGVFLASAFFQNEERFFRLILGVLVLIMLLGFVGWLTMVIYNLDVPEFSLTLFMVSTVSSLINKRMKDKNAE